MVFVRSSIEANQKYRLADAVAKARGRPLVVVAGPYGGNALKQTFHFAFHGCGELCIDLDPAACQGCPYIYGDILNLPLANGEAGSVFASHILEHMHSIEDEAQAWWELHRVSDGNVFVCVPRTDSIAGWIATDHHLWVHEVASGTLRVREREGLGRTALIMAYPPSIQFLS
jgi:hypothetical protein